jgi:hypothetical protein
VHGEWRSRKSGHSSIGFVQRRKLLIGGGIAVAGGALYRKLRRKKPPPEPDPALELRRKLDESRAVVQERDEFEAAEVPVDQAEAAIDERRRDVHRRAQASIDEMNDSEKA